MRFHNQNFFIHNFNEAPVVHVMEDFTDKDYPIALRINPDESKDWKSPNITFFFSSMSQYLKFKNSVIQAHESLIKRQNASD